MLNRFVWPLAGLLGIAGLILAFSYALAQRPGAPGFNFPMPGRFVVAHASDKQVLVLDTTSGQIYKVTEFKAGSDLPKVGELPPPPAPPGGRERPPAAGARRDAREQPREAAPPARDPAPPRDPAPARERPREEPRR